MARVHDGQWKHTADEDGEGFNGAKTWFRQVPGDSTALPADKTELQELIGFVQELLGEVEEGTEPDQYPAEALSALETALYVAEGWRSMKTLPKSLLTGQRAL